MNELDIKLHYELEIKVLHPYQLVLIIKKLQKISRWVFQIWTQYANTHMMAC